MPADLREYYQNELKYFRDMGVEFKKRYRKIAERLELGEHDSPDPHVERLLEGAAFLAARVQLKIRDDFPELTDSLLNIVYPHYLRPTPSATIAEFELDPQQGKLTTGLTIPRGSMLYTRPIEGMQCKFRTCYDTTLWPIEVASGDWRTPDKLQPAVRATGAAAVVRLMLQCAPELQLQKLAIRSLRFYLRGEAGFVNAMYELLANDCIEIVVRDTAQPEKSVRLPIENLRAVGFEECEAMLPYSRQSFSGYRLLHEYFTFPRKFQFIELSGLEQAAGAGIGGAFEVLFFLRAFEREDRWQMLEQGTSAQAFRLGCAPVVNLFQQSGEPILLKHTQYEYPVTADARRRSIQVFSVDEVVSAAPGSPEIVHYDPYFSFRHSDERSRKQAFWYAAQKEPFVSGQAHGGVWLSLVALDGKPTVPDVEAITPRLTCTNGDLSRMPFEAEGGDFELQGGGPIQRICALERPTPSVQPKTGRQAFWRLISHLSLNHLSLVNEGRDALQEIMQLYNFDESPSTARQIQAIQSVNSRPHFARVVSEHGLGFARGYRVNLEIDEEAFAGASLFLFVTVLDHFLGMYTSLNSFTQLEVRTPQRKEPVGEWQPRSGRKILV